MTRAHSCGRLSGGLGLLTAIGGPSFGRGRLDDDFVDDDSYHHDCDDDDDLDNGDFDDDSDAGVVVMVVVVVVVVVVTRLKMTARLKKAPESSLSILADDAGEIQYDAGMRHALKLHPDSRCTAVTAIDVEVERPSRGNLVLRYVVTGAIGDVRIPPVIAPARTDELWKHTCFEAFVRPSKGLGYFEFNFAPSTQWAAYRFSGYREGMSSAKEISAPPIEVQSSDAHFELRVSPDLDQLPGLSGYADWRVGLSAVIEETNGNKSYWALAHPPGKADFHHSDCFALRLPAAGRS